MDREEVNDSLDQILDDLLEEEDIDGALVSVKFIEDDNYKVALLNETTRDHEVMIAKILSDLPDKDKSMNLKDHEDSKDLKGETDKYIG